MLKFYPTFNLDSNPCMGNSHCLNNIPGPVSRHQNPHMIHTQTQVVRFRTRGLLTTVHYPNVGECPRRLDKWLPRNLPFRTVPSRVTNLNMPQVIRSPVCLVFKPNRLPIKADHRLLTPNQLPIWVDHLKFSPLPIWVDQHLLTLN